MKFPTGGDKRKFTARERLPKGKVSRSGVIPEPTVTVRMEEGGASAETLSVRFLIWCLAPV